MELILDAARLLLEALSKNEIQIQQLADQKIGQTVNLIRKNNKEIAPGIYKILSMLENTVHHNCAYVTLYYVIARIGLTKPNFRNVISGNTRLRRLVLFHQTYYELSILW